MQANPFPVPEEKEADIQESGGEEAEINSEDERTKNRWLKEWTAAGKVAHFLIMEVVNVTSFATQMETLIHSRATVIFFPGTQHMEKGNYRRSGRG